MATKFTVLGCSGSEAAGESPCSFRLGDSVLFDAGSASTRLSVDEQTKLRSIYLTHCHLDHIKDLAFIAENIFSLQSAPIDVYAAPSVLRAVQQHFFNDVIWPDFSKLPTPQRPVFKFKEMPENAPTPVADYPGIHIEAVQVNHPGPTLGFIIAGQRRAIVYAGDTGPTQRIWEAVNRQPLVNDILLETSFPNRLQSIADDAQHLTPKTLARELEKLQRRDVKIHVYHVKVPYAEEIARELRELGDPRVRLLRQGDEFELS